MLRALPIYGVLKSPFVLPRRRWTITYGTQLWFWSAEIPEGADQRRINQVVESVAKNWSDDLRVVLERTEKEHGKFEHHSTPHSFRHCFAISTLNKGMTTAKVAKYLGDTVKMSAII
jgi:integrase